MAEQHPIAPTPEMVREWAIAEWPYSNKDDELEKFWTRLATRAAQWGADQEFEAGTQLLDINGCPDACIDMLRAARRPKPPSLKQQALLQLDTLNADLAMHGRGCDLSQIRRALEALPDG